MPVVNERGHAEAAANMRPSAHVPYKEDSYTDDNQTEIADYQSQHKSFDVRGQSKTSHKSQETFRSPLKARFSTQSRLDVQLQQTSRKHESYRCSDCGACFQLRSEMKAHLRSHVWKGPHKCTTCGAIFKRLNFLEGHIQRAHKSASSSSSKPLFSCSVCGRRFLSHRNMIRHTRTHTGVRPYKCAECQKCFACKDYLKIHTRIHTRENPHQCSECTASFTTRSALTCHNFSHTVEELFKCNVCSLRFRYPEQLRSHVRQAHTEHEPYKCSVCARGFRESTDLTDHVLTHGGIVMASDYNLSEVNGNSSEVQNEPVKDQEEKPKKPSFVRSIGVRASGQMADLPHTHSKGKKYSCTVCTKCCSSIQNLRRHILIHTEGKKHKCSVREKSYNKSSNLKTHMIIHSGKKPFECVFCARCFALRSYLESHLRSHTGEKPFTCALCSSSFRYRYQLQHHMGLVHSGVKLNVCSVCAKSCQSPSSLTSHMRTHTGEKPFECSTCEKKFTQNSSLKMHNKSFHSGVNAPQR